MREVMIDGDKIKAVFILQKFVRMSRHLLPIYVELCAKDNLSQTEQRKFNKIDKIYSNFRANNEVGEQLINSPIISLIKKVVHDTKCYNQVKLFKDYQSFIAESDKLISKWNKQILN